MKTFSEPRCSCSSRLFWLLWFFSPFFSESLSFRELVAFSHRFPPSFPGFFCCKELVVFSRRFLGGGVGGWCPFRCSRWAPRFLFPFLLREGTRYFSTCFVGVVLGGSWPLLLFLAVLAGLRVREGSFLVFQKILFCWKTVVFRSPVLYQVTVYWFSKIKSQELLACWANRFQSPDMVATRSGGAKRAREEEEEENNQLSLRASNGNFPIFTICLWTDWFQTFSGYDFVVRRATRSFLAPLCDLLPLGDLFFTMLWKKEKRTVN